MLKKDLEFITSVIKGEYKKEDVDWYSVLGFLISNRVAGLFYSKAKELNIKLPLKVNRQLENIFYQQQRSVFVKRDVLQTLSKKLIEKDIPHILLKGNVLVNFSDNELLLFRDGERASNDIDFLVKPSDIDRVVAVLKDDGFIQGYFDTNKNCIVPFSRLEIIKRRMNRGELAPFVKQLNNSEHPFVEVDINFSLGNTPSEGLDLLNTIIDSSFVCSGKIDMRIPDLDLMFLHLVKHQYKESTLMFMFERTKDLELYKLVDMYYLLKTGRLNMRRIFACSEAFKVKEQVGIVLRQIGEIFDDLDVLEQADRFGFVQPIIVDYDNKKNYLLNLSFKDRLCCLDAEAYLKEVQL